MGCFTTGTQIQMHEGVKSIEEVEIGDIVKSFDVGTSSVVDSKVTKTYVHTDRYYMILNGNIKTTSVHPFYTDGKWVEAGDLSIGDKILHVDGLEHTIETIELSDEQVTVYNIEVGGTHNYFAEGYLVHNKCFRSRVKVLLEDGSLKNIEDIEIGEKLIGKDGEINEVIDFHRPTLGQFNDKLSTPLKMTSINGGEFDVSQDHIFMTSDGWKTPTAEKCKILHSNVLESEGIEDIKDLQIGDKIVTPNGLEEVTSIEFKNEDSDLQLYNFVLKGSKTYYVVMDGHDKPMLVHNKGPESLGVEEAVTISGSLDNLYRVSHGNMQVGDKVLAANIEGLPDSDIAEEFLLWEYTGSIADVITLVTASIESLTPSSHSEWLVMDCNNGRDDTFKITLDHPLLAKSGSIWAFEYPGDIDTSYKLVSSSLEEVSINSITSVTSSIDTGSFTRFDIEPQDTYFADDILVHN